MSVVERWRCCQTPGSEAHPPMLDATVGTRLALRSRLCWRSSVESEASRSLPVERLTFRSGRSSNGALSRLGWFHTSAYS